MKFRTFAGSHGGRILFVSLPVAVASALVMGGVAHGDVPVSFSISGSPFKIAATELSGTSFSQYAGVATDTDGVDHAVAIANIGQATLVDLCQSVAAETPLGPMSLVITAGGSGGAPAEATDLQIGMTDLKGDTEFTNVRIGVDASTVSTAAKGGAGSFAQDSDTIHITGLQQISYSTQAGVFTLPNMHVALTEGQECF
ncbi:MAG: hypothetical protein J0G30_03030 [Actinomycetales bacterium]|nr:hypothetical protein [Actinomycetales bacterium]